VAVAAAALAERGERVVIVDWDAHHGNGTQRIFYSDGRVLYVSMHQWPLFPGTGRLGDAGEGEGEGANVNFPFPPRHPG
jgi:acetoin utilization deacetylase AcuC-like enzyme